MELEVGAKPGAEYSEANCGRLAQRGGYRDRD